MKGTRTSSGLHTVCFTLGLILMASAGMFTFVGHLPFDQPSKLGWTSLLVNLHSQHSSPVPLVDLQIPGAVNSPLAQLRWNQEVNWQSWNSPVALSVNINQGMLNRETLHFTRIEPNPIQLVVEDYNPASSPFEDSIWSTEIAYMGFTINGTDSVRVDGFWIYLRGESKGIFRYRVYSAQPGTEAITFVNTSAPLTGWIEEPIYPTLQPGQERWVWIDTNESDLVLNPLNTYQNTFYFALARAFDDDTRINWVFCYDNENPDEDDEGDCYRYFNYYFTYRQRDFFLNVSILPENLSLFPTDIDMEVNGVAVENLSSHSKGWWDSGEFQPPLVIDGGGHEFHIAVNWPTFYQWTVEFDVLWVASLIDFSSINSGFDFTSGDLDVNWVLFMIIDFPSNVENQTILVDLESDWVVQFITRNTLLYDDWSVIDSAVLIENAEDGLWAVYCTVPISPLAVFGGVIIWVVLILILVSVVLFVFYRHQILLPRQRTRRRLLQDLADSFSDIEKIKRILLIHKETGLCLLDPIMDKTMNANLVGALIQAITTFGISLTEAEETYHPTEENDTPLREITYRDFHIVVHDGAYMRNAIIFKQPPTTQLHPRLEQFTIAFEERYAEVLENWGGRLNIFGDAIDLVDKYFFISFRLPHVVQPEQDDLESLTKTEKQLYTLARTLNTGQDSFLIRELLNRYQAESDLPSLEVLDAIFSLRQKGLITPLQTHIPYTLPTNDNATSE